jgi:hypothetical protein
MEFDVPITWGTVLRVFMLHFHGMYTTYIVASSRFAAVGKRRVGRDWLVMGAKRLPAEGLRRLGRGRGGVYNEACRTRCHRGGKAGTGIEDVRWKKRWQRYQ